MAGSRSIVVKVKHGDSLRRFSAQIVDEKLDLNMAELKDKIFSLFNFVPDADVTMTYVDEDSDVVTLVNDDDLRDAVQQALNPLRITVNLNSDATDKKYNEANGGSTEDLRDISETLGTVREDLRRLLSQIPNELISNLSSLAPGAIPGLVDYFSKAGISMGQPSGNRSSERGARASENTPPQFADYSDGFLKILSEGVSELCSKGKAKVQDETEENMAGSSGSGSSKVGTQTKSDKAGEVKDSVKPSNAPSSGPATEKQANQPCADTTWGKFFSGNWPPVPDFADSSRYGPGFGCPFSGAPVNDASAAPFIRPWRLGFGRDGKAIHRGIRCDGCGVYPIAGPRYNSNVKQDYDLCGTCFTKEGNDSDYTRFDLPVYPPFLPSKHGRHGVGLKHLHRGCKAKHGALKLDSRFIVDVNVFDGTVMPPLTPFTKIWRMRNNGSLAWPPKTQLVWMGGDKLSTANIVEVEIPSTGLPVDHELDVAIDFISPGLPGRYVSYWRMASPTGQKFGQRIWVLIQVDASANESPNASVRDLNLNLPPLNPGGNIQIVPKSGGSDQESLVPNSHPESDIPKKMVDLDEPVVGLKPNFDQEVQFPINNSLLVGDGASASNPPPVNPSAPYPVVEFPVSVTFEPDLSLSQTPPTLGASASSPEKTDEHPDDVLEDKLLKELDDMGFVHINLNKEVLRMKEYDLEQTVDQLCGVSGWDPLLKELQDMGFEDKELNKKLLEKNNGSIQRVVMDLVAGKSG